MVDLHHAESLLAKLQAWAYLSQASVVKLRAWRVEVEGWWCGLTRRTGPLLPGPCCGCGAVAVRPGGRCVKCRARARWTRRKAPHEHEGVIL